MRGKRNLKWLILIILATGIRCVKPFEPPAIQSPNSFLVVEGVAIPGTDTTTLILSRSRNLSDTTSFIPERNANVWIVSQSGQVFELSEKSSGKYKGLLSLSPGSLYQLRIVTISGSQYESAFEPVLETPPVDSVTWIQDGDVEISVNTRDPQNKTRYYRWEYIETWEYHSYYDSYIGYKNNTLYYLDSTEKTFACWDSAFSDKVIIGASEKLSEDVITNLPVTKVQKGSPKISVRYSILVKQFGLTRDAFNFWQEIKKNGSEVGGLFDPLPSQLIGNIRCTSNPGEPVIGYFSIASQTEKRLYILNNQVTDWAGTNFSDYCTPRITTADSAIYYLWDPQLAPAYYISGGGLAIAKVFCVDCTLQGGINRKPGYWP